MNSYIQSNKAVIILTSFVILFALTTVQFALAQGEKGIELSQEHKDKVAEVVQELKELAGKDFNIGEEVQKIAKEQEELIERAKEAMEKVEIRGKFKTFLIGTDYKNIGELKSEIVTTANHIGRLMKAVERTVVEEVRVLLNTQIIELEEINSNVKTFVEENEDKFSIFGWFVKLFN